MQGLCKKNMGWNGYKFFYQKAICSFVGRAVCIGKEVVEPGLKWTVGTGMSIKVHDGVER